MNIDRITLSRKRSPLISICALALVGVALCTMAGCSSNTNTTDKKPIIGTPRPSSEIAAPPKKLKDRRSVLGIPTTAVYGDFASDERPFFAYVSKVDKNKGVTTISFADRKLPDLTIPKAFGAQLKVMDSVYANSGTLLLIHPKDKEPGWTNFMIYKYQPTGWKQIVNTFSIRDENIMGIEKPFYEDPNKPGFLYRYYSVFNLDQKSDEAYQWIIHEESVKIID